MFVTLAKRVEPVEPEIPAVVKIGVDYATVVEPLTE